MSNDKTISNVRSLRIVTIAIFLPALPLCLTHGVLSHRVVPAVGLAPLASSAMLAALLLARRRARPEVEAVCGGVMDEGHSHMESTRPILVFTADIIHAAAIIVVLVFTWIGIAGRQDASLSMLAAYATIPLLIAFFVHLYLAVSAFYTGLAIHHLIQWLAWQAVPPDCPNCNHRLRPSPPVIPWLQSLPKLSQTDWRIMVPAIPTIKQPDWRVPTWLQQRREGYASLLVSPEDRYVDEPRENDGPSSVGQQEAVEVTRKKGKKKSKATPGVSEDATTSS